jgi:hypothetical protein
MQGMSDQAPPGWYPEQQTGVQRWWDGTQWGASAMVVQPVPRIPLNSTAAASYWLGLFAFLIFLLWPVAMLAGGAAVVLGILGYREARRKRHRGTGYATWGVILGGLAFLFGLTATIVTIAG